MKLQSPVLRKLVRMFKDVQEILPSEPKDVQEIVDQETTSTNTPSTLSVVEGLVDIPTSPDSKSHEEK